jgi:hypothetical protein
MLQDWVSKISFPKHFSYIGKMDCNKSGAIIKKFWPLEKARVDLLCIFFQILRGTHAKFLLKAFAEM